MTQTAQPRSVKASDKGLAKLRVAKDAKRSDNGKRLSYREIAENVFVEETTIKRFFRGERIYTDNAEAIAKFFALNLADIVDCGDIFSLRQSWGGSPDVSVFYGRAQELEQLEQWIVQERCRVIALLGTRGIGKTTLSVKLAQQIRNDFDYCIWRSLRQAPPLKILLRDLIQFLSNQARTDLIENTDEILSILIDYLRQHRCLLVLDNLETLLHKNQAGGYYSSEYEEYKELLRRIGEESHQSCLIITSLEQPSGFSSLAGNEGLVRSIRLEGLGEAAKEILRSRGLVDEEKWRTLIEFYRGNPLNLKIISNTILDLFDGKVSSFLKRRSLVFGEVQTLLEQQFERLSDLEKKIMCWFAIQGKPFPPPKPEEIESSVSEAKLLGAMESLMRRSMLEKTSVDGSTFFSLQPVAMEYVINFLNKR